MVVPTLGDFIEFKEEFGSIKKKGVIVAKFRRSTGGDKKPDYDYWVSLNNIHIQNDWVFIGSHQITKIIKHAEE